MIEVNSIKLVENKIYNTGETENLEKLKIVVLEFLYSF